MVLTDTPNNVEIPESRVSLCDSHLEELSGTVYSLVQDGNEGIDLYIDAVRIIENAIESVCCNIIYILITKSRKYVEINCDIMV